ncbi:MAG: GAF domain-containing protein [Clostridia bacterium]|nr:GAF domain-containing protein [Clostridia bacterium]
MSFASVSYPSDPAKRYALLLEQASALMAGIDHPISNMANVAALLYQALDDINWCGFYLMDRGALMLGPFCGLPACIRIPLERGVCGAAARLDAVQRVFDVHAFPGHIACDSASNSEIVIPIHHGEKVIGVLDIDSPTIGRFSETDQKSLESLVRLIESSCDFGKTGYTLA